jgi:hypothetical protein
MLATSWISEGQTLIMSNIIVMEGKIVQENKYALPYTKKVINANINLPSVILSQS